MKICIIILHLRAGEWVNGRIQTLSELLSGKNQHFTKISFKTVFSNSDDLHFPTSLPFEQRWKLKNKLRRQWHENYTKFAFLILIYEAFSGKSFVCGTITLIKKSSDDDVSTYFSTTVLKGREQWNVWVHVVKITLETLINVCAQSRREL